MSDNNYSVGTFKDGDKGWKAVAYENKVGYATHEIHFSDDGECVAEVVHGEANAKLIAAAPDLLKELQNLVMCWDNDTFQDVDIEYAKAAIEKATNQ